MSSRDSLRCMRCLYGDSHGYCTYILVMQHRRPCPPGEGCTAFEPRAGTRKPEPIAVIPPATKRPKPAPPRGKLWDRVKARALYDEGASDCDIAKACGVSQPAICNWRNALGLPPHTPPRQHTLDTERARALYDAGRTDVSIAETLGVCVGTISNWRSREGLPSKHRGGVRK